MMVVLSVLLAIGIFAGMLGVAAIGIFGLFWVVDKLGGDISEPQDIVGVFLLIVIFIALTVGCYDYLNKTW